MLLNLSFKQLIPSTRAPPPPLWPKPNVQMKGNPDTFQSDQKDGIYEYRDTAYTLAPNQHPSTSAQNDPHAGKAERAVPNTHINAHVGQIFNPINCLRSNRTRDLHQKFIDKKFFSYFYNFQMVFPHVLNVFV